MPALRGMCHKRYQSIKGLCHLNLHCLSTPVLLLVAMKDFYFLRLTLGVNFLDLVRVTYLLVRCLLHLWLSHFF